MEQIAIIRPESSALSAASPRSSSAETELSMTAIHGKAKERTLAGVHTLIFPVFHPAAALYTPANKQVLEEDFVKLQALLSRGTQVFSPAVAAAGVGKASEPVSDPEGKGAAPGPARPQLPNGWSSCICGEPEATWC